MSRSSFRGAIAAAGLAAALTAQQTVVVPAGYGVLAGNFADSYPWGLRSGVPGIRHQQIYDSGNFTLQGISTPIVIRGMRLREAGGELHPGGITLDNVTIRMSTATVDHAAVSVATAWAGHHGPDLTTVFVGAVTTSASIGSTPNDWIIDVRFATPFLYDPRSGDDLVIDVDRPVASGTTFVMDAVVAASPCPAPRGSRVYSQGSYPGPGAVTVDHALVCELSYLPATGLLPLFTADVTAGTTPLVVNFTDSSYSSDPGGVTGWAWDFENDGTIDSTARNPTWTYTTCGSYDVSLQVYDATNPPATRVVQGFVVTDTVATDFAYATTAPLTVQFTDRTTGSPTSWAWDLDGDGTVDSTVQNPAFTYASRSPVPVTLTTSRLCGAATSITRTVVPQQRLTTDLTLQSYLPSDWTSYSNLTITAPGGAQISALDVVVTPGTTPFALEVYLAGDVGGTAGHHFDPSVWTLVATATAQPLAASGVTTVPFAAPIYVPAGTYAFAIRYAGVGMFCHAATGPYGNGDLTLTPGTIANTSLGPFVGPIPLAFSGAFSGAIHYESFAFSGAAGYGYFGPGCPGTLGIATLTPSAPPVLGSLLSVTADRMPVSSAFVLTGFSRTTSTLGALPYDLGAFGAQGCRLRVSPEAVLFAIGAGNQVTWTLAIPNSASLAGVTMYQQVAGMDPSANLLGIVTSTAHALILGN